MKDLPAALGRAWPGLCLDAARPVAGGLINATWRVPDRTGRHWAVQRVNALFPAEVNLDIAAVTAHLARKGIPTPRLRATTGGTLWVETEEGLWRCLTWMEGWAHPRLSGPAMARSAGHLVGRFHAALGDLEYRYRNRRPSVHDTPRHLRRLERALESHGAHRLHAPVAGLAGPLLEAARGLEPSTALPLRHAHGDLKVSNLLFGPRGEGLCLIDLDTLGPMAWPLEMGDALRSWCNPLAEDDPGAHFDLALAEAALAGYAEGAAGRTGAAEWAALPGGVARITLELAARFLTDTLEERYFGWDGERYAAAGEHNLARARAMWRLYLDVEAKRAPLRGLCRRMSHPDGGKPPLQSESNLV